MTTEGYAQAYERGFNLTVRFLLSRGVQRDLAREAAQAAWVKGWERLAQLRDDNFVVTWVNTIALNVHRRLIRKETRAGAARQHEKTVDIDVAAIDVARILTFCRPSDRVILEQQYLNGVSTHEIATAHGVTETAIRIRLLRARRDARLQVQRRTAPCPIDSGLKPLGVDAA
ncbi:MAG TPA: sigma factor-like helix-turn-helix DNA-binding protein [Bryobacteraceae bacterium]|jgi:DNA-directed RNA polymerase specialized sigma24 family protein